MNNFENYTPDQEVLTVTKEELDRAEKELFLDKDKFRGLEKTEAELLEEAKSLKLSTEEFKHIIAQMSVAFPSGETLATMFNETDPHKTFTHTDFITAWEQTGWPKLNIAEYEGELPLSHIEKMVLGEKN